MTTLGKKDYLTILSFYNLKIPKTNGKINYKKVQEIAEHKLADKLCRCIKKVHKTRRNKKQSEARAVAICSEAVIKKKGLKYNGFKCKKRARFLSKTKKHKLTKVSKKGGRRTRKYKSRK